MKDILKKTSVPSRFTGGYFGVRRADYFTKPFVSLVKECSRFVDLTAGTGQFPYSLASSGFPVGVNDRCFYSYLILDSLFNRQWIPSDVEETLKDVSQLILPKHVQPQQRFVCAVPPSKKHGKIFKPETARYLDGVCVLLNENKENPLCNSLLYAVGKTILRWTFRKRGFYGVDPTGRLCSTYTPREVHKWILREWYRLLLYARRLDAADTKATYLDALQAVDQHNLKDAFVYVDPAWPWMEGGGKNPYGLFTNDLSSMLKGKQENIKLWERDFSTSEIMSEVEGWINRSFQCGARYFCVCTQNTNYPDPKEVYKHLNRIFKKEKMMTIQDWSSATNHHYVNYWGVYSN